MGGLPSQIHLAWSFHSACGSIVHPHFLKQCHSSDPNFSNVLWPMWWKWEWYSPFSPDYALFLTKFSHTVFPGLPATPFCQLAVSTPSALGGNYLSLLNIRYGKYFCEFFPSYPLLLKLYRFSPSPLVSHWQLLENFFTGERQHKACNTKFFLFNRKNE